jgi:hypothetical protein
MSLKRKAEVEVKEHQSDKKPKASRPKCQSCRFPYLYESDERQGGICFMCKPREETSDSDSDESSDNEEVVFIKANKAVTVRFSDDHGWTLSTNVVHSK